MAPKPTPVPAPVSRPQLRQDQQDPRAEIEQESSSYEGRLRGVRGEDEGIVASLDGSSERGRCTPLG
jgi:hypothetical protein